MRMLGRHEELNRLPLDRGFVGLDLHAEHLGPLAAVDRQHAMGRNMVDGFAEVEVVAEDAILLFVVFDLGADESARLAIDFAGSLPQVGAFAELLGQDVAGAEERAVHHQRRLCRC